ncbi:MAG: ABC transporter permease subunit [Planctomycetales bacterium]|nr:ABC transporter permease subunit [Planctomycetales bacterium]NIM08546.1 ABC transporter permease subunit [Planctomycetales bacterium]NIN08017.1 ABC transporter permease subunit [Planctomycetales bacterium]NIN77146.1 ABC transporter permease subunit [Planctomycetales bacterium]NIO34330.1 ABC transporter permease subunit [Planctomycetales bacterium]
MIINTVVLVCGTLAICIPMGVLLAVCITRTNLPGRRGLLLLIGLLLLVPLYLQTGAWQAGFGLQGWYTLASGHELVKQMRGAVWVHGVSGVAWVTLIVAVGLRTVPRALEEEALLHGSAAVVLRTVTLPQAFGAMGIAALWVAVTTAGEMTVTDLFRVRTYAEELYLAHAATADMDATALQLIPGMIVTAVMVAAGLLLCHRLMPRQESISFRPQRDFDLGGWRWPLFGLVVAIVLVLVGIPLWNLVYRAGVEVSGTADGVTARSWQISKFIELVFVQSHQQFGQELLCSLVVGISSASLVLVFASLLAWWGGAGRWQAAGVYLVVAICLAVPGPLLGVAVIGLLSGWPRVYDSLVAPSLAISLSALPVATMIMWHALRSIPASVLDAARQEGASPAAQLLYLALPARWPALAICWLIVLILAVGDLSASQLVQVPGQETLANRVFDRLHSGAYDQVCGAFLALLGLLACLTPLLFYLARLWQRQLVGSGQVE